MNEMSWLSVVYLLGVLVLAGSALAGYRLNWQRSLVYVLIWGCVFVAVAFLFETIGGL